MKWKMSSIDYIKTYKMKDYKNWTMSIDINNNQKKL